jgi:hypothetical protein
MTPDEIRAALLLDQKSDVAAQTLIKMLKSDQEEIQLLAEKLMVVSNENQLGHIHLALISVMMSTLHTDMAHNQDEIPAIAKGLCKTMWHFHTQCVDHDQHEAANKATSSIILHP